MLGALKVLQSLVERILEPLDCLDILYVHGVWSKQGGGEGWKEGRKIIYIFKLHIKRQMYEMRRKHFQLICSRSTAATTTQRFAALNSAACLCKHAILERGFLLLVVNDAP